MEHSATVQPPGADSPGETTSFRASVVIPTLDRPEHLLECLDALSISIPSDAEVIVVSDGGDKNLFPDLGRYAAPLNLKVIHAEHGGPAHARNQGLKQVNSPIVVFVDDDCRPRETWLQNMIDAVSIDSSAAAGGKTINGLPDNIFSTASQLVMDLLERDRLEQNYEPVFFPSNNLAFPTALLREIGGFDSQFRTSEDRELCRRWLQAGHRLVSAPGAVILHVPKLNLASYWRKYSSYGEGAAQFHRSSWSDLRQNSLAFHLRLPGLAAREMAESRMRRRLTLFALLALWELANLTGFVRGNLKLRKFLPSNRAAGGSPA